MSCSKSSFPGIIREIPDIGVDNFTLYNKKAYFLSHYHADHTVGLNSKRFLQNLKQTNVKIYMSEITSVIADYEFKNSGRSGNLSEHIVPLKIGSTTLTLYGKDESINEYLQVKLIPAAHSLGSVMFLFNYKNKTILYTGDFRVKPDNLPHYGQLHTNSEPVTIDSMYVDTTFQSITHNSFPSRKESVQKIIELVENWLKTDGNCVAMFARTKYAYEFVFNELYKQLGVKVYVDKFKWKLYSQIADQVKGVTNNLDEIRIHFCPKNTDNHTSCLPHSPPANYLYIYMSAYKWTRGHEERPYIEETRDKSYSICFSTHCSRSELIYFVNYFSPKRVVGFRDDYIGNSEVSYDDTPVIFSQSTPKKERDDFKLERKVDKDVLKKSFDW